MDKRIEVTHPNGYRGVLYGRSSMSIYNAEGKEVLHTGFRTINTEKALYKQLEGFPKFRQMLSEKSEDIYNDTDDDNDI